MVALASGYSPYASDNRCVSCFETDVGEVLGAEVQSCAYPNSICAVRSGIVTAISRGARKFFSLNVLHQFSDHLEPCGACLEFLAEFVAKDFPIKIQSPEKDQDTTLGELLPGYRSTREGFLQGAGFSRSPYTSFVGYKLADNVTTPKDWTRADFEKLVKTAVAACANSYVIRSGFPVGAAIAGQLTDTVNIYPGSNVEHYYAIGLGLCAERAAMCNMVSSGNFKIKALAVLCELSPEPGRPCGGCRQSLMEWGDFAVFMLSLNHEKQCINVEESRGSTLLPHAFTAESLR